MEAMRIMVFGRQAFVARLASAFRGEDAQVSNAIIPAGGDVEDAILHHDCDLIVIESGIQDAAHYCAKIRERLGDVPVVIVTRRNDTDWNRMAAADVDGYISYEAGNEEINARLKAIVRSSRAAS